MPSFSKIMSLLIEARMFDTRGLHTSQPSPVPCLSINSSNDLMPTLCTIVRLYDCTISGIDVTRHSAECVGEAGGGVGNEGGAGVGVGNGEEEGGWWRQRHTIKRDNNCRS